MKTVLIVILAQMLLLVPGGCTVDLIAKTEDNPEPTVAVTNDWEEQKVCLNELKDLLLEQEGLFNVRRREDGCLTVKPREDIQVELDMERVSELMDELGLYMVYVRPTEEYFGFKEAVELMAPWRTATDICYSSTAVPESSWDDEREWIDLGDGWYTRYTEEI